MAEAAASRQILRKVALMLAYALVVAFGAAAMLAYEQRPFDRRGLLITGIAGGGALLAGALVMFWQKRLLALPPLQRFFAVLLCSALLTLFAQAVLAAIAFNITNFKAQGSLATLDGLETLFFTSAYGFLYYFAYGLSLAWPAGLIAVILFALGFLTLRP